ncbi:hypothetical protein [Streptomyces sp. NPDC004284]
MVLSLGQFSIEGLYRITTHTAAPGREIGTVGRSDDHGHWWTEYANV